MNLFKFLNPAQHEALAWQLLSVASGAGLTGLLWGGQRVWIVTCGAFLAFTLFLWRMKFRFVYGLIELAFGLFVLWNSADKGRGSSSSDFSADFDAFQLSVIIIQTAGAIYILVRGMDNVLQGLPAATRDRIESRIKEWHM